MMILKIITPSPKRYKFPIVIGGKSSLIIKINLINKWIVTNMLLYRIGAGIIFLIKFKTRIRCNTTCYEKDFIRLIQTDN